jgi:hypothetical protein
MINLSLLVVKGFVNSPILAPTRAPCGHVA